MDENANQLERPQFEICVVKRVVNTFTTGVDDVFKPAIQKMVDDKNKRNASNRRRELLNEFCEDRSYISLAVLSDMSSLSMKKILIGQLDCGDDQWARILDAFELMA